MVSGIRAVRAGAALLALVMSVLCTGEASAAWHRRRSFAQRHPVLTSAAAGAAAYHYSKSTGRGRRYSHRRRNFAQRHPVLTGAAAAAATHHVVKRHR